MNTSRHMVHSEIDFQRYNINESSFPLAVQGMDTHEISIVRLCSSISFRLFPGLFVSLPVAYIKIRKKVLQSSQVTKCSKRGYDARSCQIICFGSKALCIESRASPAPCNNSPPVGKSQNIVASDLNKKEADRIADSDQTEQSLFREMIL